MGDSLTTLFENYNTAHDLAETGEALSKSQNQTSQDAAITDLTAACKISANILIDAPEGIDPFWLPVIAAQQVALQTQIAGACTAASQSAVQNFQSAVLGWEVAFTAAVVLPFKASQALANLLSQDASSGNPVAANADAQQLLAITPGSGVTFNPDGTINISGQSSSSGTSWTSFNSSWTSSWLPSSVTIENFGGSSIVESFNSDGSTTTTDYSAPEGTGSVTEIDQENANSTSQITIYNTDGSATATTYADPNGTGSITKIDQENSNGTSQITIYNPDGSTTATTYSSPNGAGSATKIDQENANGTSQITTPNGGSPSGKTYSDPHGTGVVIGTDSTQNIVIYNYVGSPYDIFHNGLTPDPDSSPLAGLNETATITFPQVDIGSPQSDPQSLSASVSDGQVYLDSSSNTSGTPYYNVIVSVQLDASGNIIGGGVGGGEQTTTDFYAIGNSLINNGGNYDDAGDEALDSSYNYAAYSSSPGTWSSPVSAVALQVSTSEGETQPLAEALTNSGMFAASTPQWVTISGPGTAVASGTEAISNVEVSPSSNLVLQAGTLMTDPFTVDGDGNVIGYGTITGNEVDNGTVTASDGTLELTGDIVGGGTLTFVPGGALQLDGTVAATESLIFNAPNETLIVGASAGVLSPVSGFGSGDQIIVNTTAAATFSLNGSIVSVIETSATVETLTFTTPQMAQGAITGTAGTLVDNVLCFLPGTLITTPSGQREVERLAAGDMVLTASGQVRPIAWIGTGQVLATRGRRTAATPVIVRKGALGPNVPHQDLQVTKGHSLFLDGVLIPVEFLVNHRSIIWDDRAQEVTVYHVELDTHDVLLANGAPAESYRDDGNRWLFQNANSGWDLPPKPPCAPVLTGGPIVDAVWRRLLDRAGPRPGTPLTDDPDLHLLVDGVRLDAGMQSGDFYIFNLRHAPTEVRLASRAGTPQELGLARDPRCLGVAVRRIVVRQKAQFRNFDATDARLIEGFHAFEANEGFRWTNGDAALPIEMFAGLAGPIEVVLHIGATAQYIEGAAAVRAA